jgi:hypothetical protein
MADCASEGNTDMYGLGVRLGFYIQWYAIILANWLSIKGQEAQNLRFGYGCLNFATFLAMVVSTSLSALLHLDIYITLLLSSGRGLFLVPLYIWRIATRFDPALDPLRWTRVWPGKVFSILNTAITAAVSAFQIWFWVVKAPIVNKGECLSYGFIFARVPLQNYTLRMVSCVLYSCLLFESSETVERFGVE